MFTDEVLDRFYGNPRLSQVPVYAAGEAVKAFTEVLEEMREENPYATLSELFDD